MTYRKLLMALSIATMFIVATSYPHMGDAIYTDRRLASVGSPVRKW